MVHDEEHNLLRRVGRAAMDEFEGLEDVEFFVVELLSPFLVFVFLVLLVLEDDDDDDDDVDAVDAVDAVVDALVEVVVEVVEVVSMSTSSPTPMLLTTRGRAARTEAEP